MEKSERLAAEHKAPSRFKERKRQTMVILCRIHKATSAQYKKQTGAGDIHPNIMHENTKNRERLGKIDIWSWTLAFWERNTRRISIRFLLDQRVEWETRNELERPICIPFRSRRACYISIDTLQTHSIFFGCPAAPCYTCLINFIDSFVSCISGMYNCQATYRFSGIVNKFSAWIVSKKAVNICNTRSGWYLINIK